MSALSKSDIDFEEGSHRLIYDFLKDKENKDHNDMVSMEYNHGFCDALEWILENGVNETWE